MTTWHCLRVMTQRESTVAAELNRGLGLSTYVPSETSKIIRARRVVEVERCLIPGYVFAGHLEGMPWRDVSATRHVIGPLLAMDAPATLSQAEIDRMRALERAHNQTLANWRTFRAGDRIRIKDGPFANVETLLRAVRGKQATIEVPMLSSTRAVSVALDNLEKVA